MDGIHKSLRSMAVDISSLIPLDRNPRSGDIPAIIASYEEFGQVKPIVARKNDDGTATVIAGNHQLAAATELGWDKIAVVYLEGDESRAIAFALADNRTVELGYSDPDVVYELINEVTEYYPELIEGLGWDEFELAEYEQEIERGSSEMSTSGVYVPPVLISRPDEDMPEIPDRKPTFNVSEDDDGERRIVAPSSANQSDVAIRGSTVANQGERPQAVVQYTIVFDSPDQQSRWYDFVRWLKSDPGVDGATTAERLIDFISQHTEF
jgi:ParB-like chromosome segregation protein Spo0J